ncbi:MAG TPA: hypothetical protein VFH53_00135, partial [Phycisphaerae bacterium]|nr:hypothetical protein [Phycisphaerae bacterium]
IGAGYRWVSSGGKRKPTGTTLALDAIENSVGNVYMLGDTFYAGRRLMEKGMVYGTEPRRNPIEQVVASWFQGVGGVYIGLDQAISGERYKAGARKGGRKAPRTLGRAVSSLLEAVGYSLGLPVAPLAYWRSVLRFTEGDGAAVAKAGEEGDTEGLAWTASGEGAGAAAAVEKLKAAGVTYIEARRALRDALHARGDRSAKAWFARSGALRKAWYGAGGPGPAGERRTGLSRSRAGMRSPVLGQSGASTRAAGGGTGRLGGFRGKTAPAVPGRTGRGGALTRA